VVRADRGPGGAAYAARTAPMPLCSHRPFSGRLIPRINR
jgi:hypothetical protein